MDILPAILVVSITMIVIFLLFMFFSKTAKTRKLVLFFRPRDKRGEVLEITGETDRSVLCEKSDPIHRFIKVGPAFTFKERGRVTTQFLGLEGTAYTAQLKNVEPFKLSTSDYLKSLWGEHNFNALPSKMRNAVEKDIVGVTVEPTPIDHRNLGLPSLSSDDVNDEGDSFILTRLARLGSTESVKTKLLGNLVWFGLGVGFAAILANIGWF